MGWLILTIIGCDGNETVVTDDVLPIVTIADVSVTEGGVATFTFVLHRAAEETVVIDWATSTTGGNNSVDAQLNVDFTINSGQATISAGADTTTVTVTTLEDLLVEGPETFLLGVTNISEATVGDSSAIGTILDNETLPNISIDDVTVNEGTVATFTITADKLSEQNMSVVWSITHSTTEDADFPALTGSSIIIAGNTTTNINVTNLDDILDENNEAYSLTLSSPVGVAFADSIGAGIINDNDGSPSLSLSDATIAEGTSATMTVSLNTVSGRNVSFNWSTADGVALAPADYTSNSAIGTTILAGSLFTTFTVASVEDITFESNENFDVNLAAPVNASITDGLGVITITDNDAVPTILIDDVSVTEASNLTFTLSLGTLSEQNVQVTWTTANNTAVAPGDYTAASGTATILAGNATTTVTITVNDEGTFEDDETLFVNLSSPINASITDAQGIGTVTNNDSAPTLSVNDVSINESGVLGFTVTQSAVTETDTSFNWATSDGTAVGGTDFTSVAATPQTITAGNLTATLNINTISDLGFEADETVNVTLTSAANATFADSAGIGTITNDDPTPTIAIDDVTVTEGTTVDFTITLTGVSFVDSTVNWASSDSTATAPGDYIANSGTATITAGNNTAIVSITTVDDPRDEDPQTFDITLSVPVNCSISDTIGVGLLNDNDPVPDMTVNNVTVTEGGTATFTVTLSAASEKAVGFDWISSNSTALTPGDYTAGSGVGVNFTLAVATKTFDVVTIDDILDEVTETFDVTISNATNSNITSSVGVGTITDNDLIPNITVNDMSVTEASTATFTITISAISTNDVLVDWTTVNGSASSPTDFTANGGTLTITAGTTSKTVDIVTIGNVDYEQTETYTIALSNAVDGLITDATGLGTITDDDTAPDITIDDVTVTEGTNLTFTVSKTGNTEYPATFDWTTSNGVALAGSDYTANSGSETIAAGVTTKVLTVVTTNDALDENSEGLAITISNPGDVTISDNTGLGTINDNDSTTTLSIDDLTLQEGGTMAFTVSLNTASGRDVTVDWTTVDGTATSPADFTAASGTMTILEGATTGAININTIDDAVVCESNQDFTIALSNPSGANIADATGVGTITDNDPTLSISDETDVEGNVLTFTITQSAICGSNVTVDWATSNNSAVAPGDYTATTGTATITAGLTTTTVPVTTIDDGLAELNQNFRLNLSNPTNALISDAIGVGTLTDNDVVPNITINDVGVTEGASASFTVTLSFAANSTVTVDYATADSTAVAGSDYTNTSGTLSIPAGNTIGTIIIPVPDDATDDNNTETFNLNLSNTNLGSITDSQGIGTITDNDSPPSISIDDVTVIEGIVASFTVTLSTTSEKNIDVNWTTNDGTATDPADYTNASGTASIIAGVSIASINITTIDDSDFEPSGQDFTVTLNTPVNVTIADGSGTATLTDNEPIRLNPLLVSNGNTQSFQLSSDSAVAVYMADQDTDGVVELYSVNLNGSNPLKLNSALVGGGNVVQFEITPDASTVIYLADQDSDEVFELYSVGISGGGVTKVSPSLGAGEDVTNFAISSDSSKIVYISDEDVDEDFELFSMNLNGSSQNQVNGVLVGSGDVSAFRISEDSSKVVYLADINVDGTVEINSTNMNGSGDTTLNAALPAGGNITQFRISSDSSQVVFIGDVTVDEDFELQSVNIGGGGPVTIDGGLVAGGDVTQLLISGDSSKVVYIADEDNDDIFQIYSVNIGGGAQATLSGVTGAEDVSDFLISANSSKVVYLADETTDGTNELYSVNMNGTGGINISGALALGGNVIGFIVSTDSANVAFVADKTTNGINELYKVAIGGGAVTTLNVSLPAGGNVETDVKVTDNSVTVIYRSDMETNNVTDLISQPF